eukprot:6199719-Amphidinium_carterae.2
MQLGQDSSLACSGLGSSWVLTWKYLHREDKYSGLAGWECSFRQAESFVVLAQAMLPSSYSETQNSRPARSKWHLPISLRLLGLLLLFLAAQTATI